MIPQKLLDQFFECLKPYLNIRRVLTFLVLTVFFSRGAESVYFLWGCDFEQGWKYIKKAINTYDFFSLCLVFSICVYLGPVLSSFFSKLSVRVNYAKGFMKKVFDDAEEAPSVEITVLEKRKSNFIALAKHVNCCLELVLTVYLILNYHLIRFSHEQAFVIFLASSAVCSLVFYETASYMLRKYARSIYLLRLRYDEIEG